MPGSQDYVKTVPASHKVAWTRYPEWLGYFPCKNSLKDAQDLSKKGVPPHSASTSEMAVYHLHAQSLRTLGASVGEAAPRSFQSVEVMAGPAIVLAPSFAPCFTLLAAKLPTPSNVSITSRSSLVIKGAKVTIERLELDGALVIDVADGGSLVIKSLSVQNEGWAFEELDEAGMKAAAEESAIRGYTLSKRGQRLIRVDKGDEIVVENGKARKASVAAKGGSRVPLEINLEASMRRKKKKVPPNELTGQPSVIKIETRTDGGGCCCAIM